MNFFSRSSRATGPNTRVPTGSPSLVIEDRRVVVEADVRAVPPAVVAPRPHDDRPHDPLPVLLDERRVGRRLLDRGRDDVAEARVAARPSRRASGCRRSCARRSCPRPRGSFPSGSWLYASAFRQDLAQAPALELRQRPGLLDPDAVAHLRLAPSRRGPWNRLVRLIVRLYSACCTRRSTSTTTSCPSCPTPRGPPSSPAALLSVRLGRFHHLFSASSSARSVGLDPRDVPPHRAQAASGSRAGPSPSASAASSAPPAAASPSPRGPPAPWPRQRLPLLLLHRISISDSRVTRRVFRPSLSAASSAPPSPSATSTPSIS